MSAAFTLALSSPLTIFDPRYRNQDCRGQRERRASNVLPGVRPVPRMVAHVRILASESPLALDAAQQRFAADAALASARPAQLKPGTLDGPERGRRSEALAEHSVVLIVFGEPAVDAAFGGRAIGEVVLAIAEASSCSVSTARP